MKFHISFSFFTFFFVYFIYTFPNIKSQPLNIRKTPANKNKKVNFDLSEVDPIVTERTLNELLISIDNDLLVNPEILTELITGVLSGILSKEVNITGHQCIATLQKDLNRRFKAYQSRFIKSLIENSNESDKCGVERLQELCYETKKDIRERLGEVILSKDKTLALYYERLEYKQASKRVLQRDIDVIKGSIKYLEREIILNDNQIVRYRLFDCNKLPKKISFIHENPIGIKSEIILDINELFVKCYRGMNNAIHRLRTQILRHEKMNIKNEKVTLNMFALFTTRYRFLSFGKKLRAEKITTYFSRAQIAEGKVLKSIGELKKKYPNKKENMLQNEEILLNKKKVAYNTVMAVVIAAKDVLFV